MLFSSLAPRRSGNNLPGCKAALSVPTLWFGSVWGFVFSLPCRLGTLSAPPAPRPETHGQHLVRTGHPPPALLPLMVGLPPCRARTQHFGLWWLLAWTHWLQRVTSPGPACATRCCHAATSVFVPSGEVGVARAAGLGGWGGHGSSTAVLGYLPHLCSCHNYIKFH